ncbi:MAG TPA: hypothetical protein VN843_09415, partial [Anaerolineales bacterium]|nr:hypothetical protein [Anaerolineales bacterium]
MTLVQKSINGTEYYTDGNVYYTFHQVKVAKDTLWSFACRDLGITEKTGFFTSQETKNITDLAGISSLHPTKFLLLSNGNAIPVPYLNGSSNLQPNDIILRSAVAPAVGKKIIPPVTTVVPPSVSTKSVADRLNDIEDLHNMKLLTDPEYQDKRAK